jgi:intraflagellar transport protein 88
MRANMGNIYYEQKNYGQAIKMYQMAMDQIPNTAKEMRFHMMRNIGNCYFAMGRYEDGAQIFETVLESIHDAQSGREFTNRKAQE